jgi:hypothetical protein
VFITDQPDPDVAALELRHRRRARVEDRIRGAKATGLRNLPFDRCRRSAVWLELVLAARDLTCWAQTLMLSGELLVPSQDAALPAVARGRPHRPPRPPPDRALATQLALGHCAGCRVHSLAGAAVALLTPLPRSRPAAGSPAWPACPRRPRRTTYQPPVATTITLNPPTQSWWQRAHRSRPLCHALHGPTSAL